MNKRINPYDQVPLKAVKQDRIKQQMPTIPFKDLFTEAMGAKADPKGIEYK